MYRQYAQNNSGHTQGDNTDHYKTPFLVKNTKIPTWSQIILGTIAELLAVVGSMNDVCEAQKMCFLDTLNLKTDF